MNEPGFRRVLAAMMMALVSLLAARFAFAQDTTMPNLCMVLIKDSAHASVGFIAGNTGKPEPAGIGRTMLSGLSAPVLYGQGVGTITSDNSFARFPGDFPASWLFDRFAVEPDGRVLGVKVGGGSTGLHAFDPSNGRFRLIVPIPFTFEHEGGGFQIIQEIVHVRRLDTTLIGTDNGVFQLHGSTVRPLAGATGRVVGAVSAITELPVHAGVMLAGATGAWLRHDDGAVEKLIDTTGTWFTRADEITGAFESIQPGRIVLRGVFARYEVEMRREKGGFAPIRTRTLFSYAASTPWFPTLLTASGEYLLFHRPSWSGHHGLERLDPDGLHEIPGDPAPAPAQESWDTPWMSESTALGLVLIRANGRWYSYDGKQFRLIDGASRSDISRLSIPTDMPSIGKTVIATSTGLSEFTADRGLIELPVPLAGKAVALADFPAAHVGLIATEGNIYALSRSGAVQPVPGSDSDVYSYKAFIGHGAAMLVQGRAGIHMILPSDTCPSPH